jgi:hypothetical protein
MAECIHCEIHDLLESHLEAEDANLAEIASKVTEVLADLILMVPPPTGARCSPISWRIWVSSCSKKTKRRRNRLGPVHAGWGIDPYETRGVIPERGLSPASLLVGYQNTIEAAGPDFVKTN